MKSQDATIQMKAYEQYFPVELFTTFAVRGGLTFESMDEIPYSKMRKFKKLLRKTFLWSGDNVHTQ